MEATPQKEHQWLQKLVEMPGGGGPVTSLMTLGYDPQRKRFVGTFVARTGNGTGS